MSAIIRHLNKKWNTIENYNVPIRNLRNPRGIHLVPEGLMDLIGA